MLITRMEQYCDGSECEGFGKCDIWDGRLVARYNVDIQLYDYSSDTITVPMCEKHVSNMLMGQFNERTRRSPDNHGGRVEVVDND